MALADYYDRAAVAAAQVLGGFDEDKFRSTVEGLTVGVAVNEDAATGSEGIYLTDMTIRLLSRFYPRLAIRHPDSTSAGALAALARRINPRIDIVDDADIGIVIGAGKLAFRDTVFAGSDGFDALVSHETPLSAGDRGNPFGPGASAALACAALFRRLLMNSESEGSLVLSTLTGELTATPRDEQRVSWELDDGAVLVGVGAIGNASLWALARANIGGELHIVDQETVELSNVQRYVLAEQADVGKAKVELSAGVDASLNVVAHSQSIEEFIATTKHRIHYALLGLDSADARRHVQASLPLALDNAWTQPGDLGVSRHGTFGTAAACVFCLYLPTAGLLNEDQIVAEALGIPERTMQVRVLLHDGSPVDGELLEAIGTGLDVPVERLRPFEGRTLRDLYVRGLCGGAVVPLSRMGTPRQELHVPLAHQSALAGVLLGAALVRRLQGSSDGHSTEITRLDVLRPVGQNITQLAAAQGDGRCLCEDPDFRDAYAAKWRSASVEPGRTDRLV